MNGKGGTGKTTVASLLVKYLVRNKKGAILAIDADPNSNLSDLLGVKGVATMSCAIDDVAKNMDKIPAGMTKERFIDMRVHETLHEEKDFDLLVMGRPEGPGCYCYVNSLLREMTARMTKNYDFVVIDNAAGMEHISRKTTRTIDKLILVADCSAIGIRSAKRIYELARELGINMGKVFLVVNKLTGTVGALKGEIDKSGLSLAGAIPYDTELEKASLSERPIFELKSEAVGSAVEKIFKVIME